MADILRQRLIASRDTFANAVGHETVLLQARRGTYYGLNETGTRIWEGLNNGRTPLEICEEFAKTFDVPREGIEADVAMFLEDLMANEIIVAE